MSKLVQVSLFPSTRVSVRLPSCVSNHCALTQNPLLVADEDDDRPGELPQVGGRGATTSTSEEGTGEEGTLREFLEVAYLQEFVQPMEEKGLKCLADIERELGLPESLEESALLESLGMKPVEAKRLRRWLELQSINNGASSMANGGTVIVTQTSFLVPANSSPESGNDNACPYWLGCANQGFCCCYNAGGLCRVANRDVALHHFDGALHWWWLCVGNEPH